MKRLLKQMPVEKPVGYFVLFHAKTYIVWQNENKHSFKKTSLIGPIQYQLISYNGQANDTRWILYIFLN